MSDKPSIQKKVTIIASDLDGTLLSPEHQLTPYTKSVLQKLHQQGYIFSFATGRHYFDVKAIRKTLGIPAYMITSNGARIHAPDDTLLHASDLPSELINPVIDLVKSEQNIQINLYDDNTWYSSKTNDDLAKYHADSGFPYVLFDVLTPPTESISKIYLTDDSKEHQLLAAYEIVLKEKLGDRLHITFSTPWCLEIMAKEVSKGHALQLIAEQLNMTLSNCICFGDGMNDLEMLTMAGLGLVMENAHDKLKHQLPNHQIIGSNQDDAVAHYLADLLLESAKA